MTDYEVVVCVFRREDENVRGVSLGQTSLFFANTKAVLEWADAAGVDFT